LRGRTLLLSRRRLLHHQRRNVPYTTSNTLAKRFARHYILLFVDGAPNHSAGDLVIPDNVRLEFLPPYSPELNPQENLWEEIREKIFKNYALKSMDKVYDKLQEAAPYLERNPKIVQSITAFPYIAKSF
jgi:hypothetical protein